MGNRLVDTAREGEGGTNWGSSMGTHTSPYVNQGANVNFLYDWAAQSSTQYSETT